MYLGGDHMDEYHVDEIHDEITMSKLLIRPNGRVRRVFDDFRFRSIERPFFGNHTYQLTSLPMDMHISNTASSVGSDETSLV